MWEKEHIYAHKSKDAHVNPHAHNTHTQQTPPPHFIACFWLQRELSAERDLTIVGDRTTLAAPAIMVKADCSLTVQQLYSKAAEHCTNVQMQMKWTLVYFAFQII